MQENIILGGVIGDFMLVIKVIESLVNRKEDADKRQTLEYCKNLFDMHNKTDGSGRYLWYGNNELMQEIKGMQIKNLEKNHKVEKLLEEILMKISDKQDLIEGKVNALPELINDLKKNLDTMTDDQRRVTDMLENMVDRKH